MAENCHKDQDTANNGNSTDNIKPEAEEEDSFDYDMDFDMSTMDPLCEVEINEMANEYIPEDSNSNPSTPNQVTKFKVKLLPRPSLFSTNH